MLKFQVQAVDLAVLRVISSFQDISGWTSQKFGQDLVPFPKSNSKKRRVK